MAKIKVKSKRVPLHRKASIKRKAKESDRKARRDAKANPHLRKKLKKDLGIPNLNPFKAQMLAKLEAQKKGLLPKAGALAGGAAALAADAAGRSADYSEAHPAPAEGGGGGEGEGGEAVPRPIDRILAGNTDAGGSTRRAFFKHLRSVMEKADIILEVLDARDPLACRSAAVESLALAQRPPKRVVLVLNKIDLVPAAAVQAWLKHLRREFPAIAFKASTQQQRSHLAAPGGGTVNKATQAGEVLTGSGAAGADTLLQLIKNYARSHDIKRAVTVGVVGYPNVGKSSIINSLKRSKAVGVSATPGFTRCMQEVSLDAKVTLLDCPGIIFDDPREEVAEGGSGSGSGGGGGDGGAGLLLRNCIAVDQIEDPEAAVDGILRRCAPAKLMSLFCIPAYASTEQFLGHVAAKRFMVGRGGVPDKKKAARVVLQEWNSGKIPFFVMPPAERSSAEGMEEEAGAAAAGAGGALRVSAGDVGVASIVQEWAKVRFVCVCVVVACFGWGWLGGWIHAEVNGPSLSSMERPCYPLCKREWDSGPAVALAVLDSVLGPRLASQQGLRAMPPLHSCRPWGPPSPEARSACLKAGQGASRLPCSVGAVPSVHFLLLLACWRHAGWGGFFFFFIPFYSRCLHPYTHLACVAHTRSLTWRGCLRERRRSTRGPVGAWRRTPLAWPCSLQSRRGRAS